MAERSERRKTLEELALVIVLVSSLVGALSGFLVTKWEVGELKKDMAEVKERVMEMYCAQVPATKREGCR